MRSVPTRVRRPEQQALARTTDVVRRRLSPGCVHPPATDFGQREHLSAVAVSPYLIAVGVHWWGVARRRVEMAAVGALATVGFFVKPHFVAFATAIWVAEFLAARGSLRRMSAETWVTALGTVVAYGTFLLLEPGYLTDIVPSQGATYLADRGSFLSALNGHRTILVLVALSLMLASLFVWDEGFRGLRMLVLRLGWPLYVAGLVLRRPPLELRSADWCSLE